MPSNRRLVFVANPFHLSPVQLKGLAEICRDAAQIFLASWVISPTFLDGIDWLYILVGLSATGSLWYVYLVILRKLE